jgi:hypothetical protein
MALVQVHDTRENGLEMLRLHTGDRHAVVTHFDHRVAVVIGGDELRQSPHCLRVREMVELDRMLPGIKVADGLGSHARPEHEIVAQLDRGLDARGRIWRGRLR